MGVTEIFDPSVDAAMVEQAVIETLRLRLPEHLGHKERQRGWEPGTLEDIRAWTPPRGAFDRWPEEQLPCIVTVSSGTTDPPRREGDGSYTLTWGFGSLVVIRAATEDDSNELSKIYAAAIRDALVQNGGLDDSVSVVEFTLAGENYDDLPVSEDRTMLAARVYYTVEVAGVVNSRRGPADPPDDPRAPQSDWPTVTEPPELTVEHKT